MVTLTLTGSALTLNDLDRFTRAGSTANVHVDRSALVKVGKCAAYLEKLSLGEKAYYGINTGFGRFARTRVPQDQAAHLQENLVRSHAVGMGPPVPSELVRLMMVLRVNSLLAGHSGVSVELVETLVAMINAGISPWVPCYGSVGASGDLAPLAHIALSVLGEGDAVLDGERIRARDALVAAGINPYRLRAKEGLALINGTQLMAAYAVHGWVRMRSVLGVSMAAAAMSLEAYEATDAIFDGRIHALKPHPGQIRTAEVFRTLCAGSDIIAAHAECDRVQDPYSFRCIPQVLGAVMDTMAWTRLWIEREINAVTDNPLVFPADDAVLSGGNFHGEHMALALDAMSMAFAEIGSIAERRVDKLMDAESQRLPRCLIRDPGLNSGLMITQYLAAALVSENKVLAHPSSVDSIPTSMGFEDHVSMGSVSALKMWRVVENVTRIVAVELLCGAQALDFHRPLKPGAGTSAILAAVRETVPFLEGDCVLSDYLAELEGRVASGELLAAVEAATGPLPLDAAA